jgi:hypothetical protein
LWASGPLAGCGRVDWVLQPEGVDHYRMWVQMCKRILSIPPLWCQQSGAIFFMKAFSWQWYTCLHDADCSVLCAHL